MNRIDLTVRPGLPFLFVRNAPAWAMLYPLASGLIRARLRPDAEAAPVLEFTSVDGSAFFEPIRQALVFRCPGAATAGLTGRYLYDVELISGPNETVIFGGEMVFEPLPPAYVPAFAPSSTLDEMQSALIALTARGRAWQTSPPVAEDTGMKRFWRGIAESFLNAERHLDDLRAEMFCRSAVATRDNWEADYSLPDACDPFEDLAAKAGGMGDTLPAYAETAAAFRGWSVSITEQITPASGAGVFGSALFGAASPAATNGATWHVMIDTLNSPVGPSAVPLFGTMLFGNSLACPADTSALECILRRIAPAHVDLVYQEI